jgi:hypothetical protein
MGGIGGSSRMQESYIPLPPNDDDIKNYLIGRVSGPKFSWVLDVPRLFGGVWRHGQKAPRLTAEGLETAVHEGFPASCSSRKSSHLHWQMVHAAYANELAP